MGLSKNPEEEVATGSKVARIPYGRANASLETPKSTYCCAQPGPNITPNLGIRNRMVVSNHKEHGTIKEPRGGSINWV